MSDHDHDATTHRRLLYGRRQGHKLRQGQQELLRTLLPKLSVDPSNLPSLSSLFDQEIEDLWLEIGFGGGEHLAALAAENPQIGFLGCEPFVNGVAKLLAQIDRLGLANIRIYHGDARDVLDRLADRSLGRVMLLFPDPWPKKRHHKRRFINDETLPQIARVLRPGGEFRVATDIPDYCRWTLGHILRSDSFDWLAERPADWREHPPDWTETRYEKKARRQGRTPVYLKFRRKP